ncbi:15211_t:CDS:2, partial [Racocetra fulgida]
MVLQFRDYIPLSRPSSNVVTPPPLPPQLGNNASIGFFGIHAFSPYNSSQVQSGSLEDDSDCFDDLSVNENPSIEVQHLISKMENVNHCLFEYRIVNLSEKNLVDPMEPSTEEKSNTVRKSRWEKSIKPLVDKYASAIEIKSAFDDEIQTLSTETNDQKPRILLGSNYDGILKIYVNANEIEIGFLEVVGNATVVDFKKYREDKEKLLK